MKNLRTKLSYALCTLLVVFLMVKCNTPDAYEKKTQNGMTYKLIVIDSCEYIWYKDRNQYGQTMTHKGNCKNH